MGTLLLAGTLVAVVAATLAYAVTAWCVRGRSVLAAECESRQTWPA